MLDQAHKLRQLMKHRSPASRPSTSSGAAPRMVLVCGGRQGVGATTTAIQLAMSLARQGHRSVLVDADLEKADATHYCEIRAFENLAHVLAGQRTIHETLHPGPAGIQVLPGAADTNGIDCSPAAQQRFGRELATLGRYADFAIVDAGSALTQFMRYLWETADSIQLVSTTSHEAILDAYAAVKMLRQAISSKTNKLQMLVNRAAGEHVAKTVQQRIQNAGRQFLEIEISAAGWLVDDGAVERSVVEARDGGGKFAHSVLASQFEHLAELIAKHARTSLANAA